MVSQLSSFSFHIKKCNGLEIIEYISIFGLDTRIKTINHHSSLPICSFSGLAIWRFFADAWCLFWMFLSCFVIWKSNVRCCVFMSSSCLFTIRKSKFGFCLPPFFRILSNNQTHMLHVWNIYQPHKSHSFVGQYTIHGAFGKGMSKNMQKQHAPHSEQFIVVPLATGAARAASLLRLGRPPATSHPPPCAIRDACGYQYRPQMQMVTMVPVVQNKGIPGRSLCFFSEWCLKCGSKTHIN